MHVANAGVPVQLRETVPVNPFIGENCNGNCADCPAEMILLLGAPDDSPIKKSVPAPKSTAVCGFPEALSVIVRVPICEPTALGVKLICTMQLAPGATLAAQPLAAAKSPLAVTDDMLRVLPPEFVSVIVCGALVVPTCWLENERLVGDSVTACGRMPIPVSAVVCGLPVALSVIVRAPVREPVARSEERRVGKECRL